MSTHIVKKILYLGTSLGRFSSGEAVLHYPVIRLIPKLASDLDVRFCLDRLALFSHILLTSQNSVSILWDLCISISFDPLHLLQGKCISIGSVTSHALRSRGVEPCFEALVATQEGMIDILQEMIDSISYVFYPRSSLARPLLREYLIKQKISHEILDLYDTVYQAPKPKPSLEEIEEIFFTSPSTVDGFFQVFSKIPEGIRISFQGSITKKYFEERCENLKI
jgi:uroporphyrinogen-III synthase